MEIYKKNYNSYKKSHTLSGLYLIFELFNEALSENNMDCSKITVKFNTRPSIPEVHLMFPTPHTYFARSIIIIGEELIFYTGLLRDKNKHVLSLTDKNITAKITEIFKNKIKSHRASRKAILENQ